jgi:CBS domain-containing protein
VAFDRSGKAALDCRVWAVNPRVLGAPVPVLVLAFPPGELAVAWCEAAHNRLEALMRIADVLRNKGAAVVTINPDATVRELLAGLAEQNIGAMVVVGAEGVVGIVSERDVVRQLHSHGASLMSRPISKIMTSTIATCTKSDSVDAVSALMTNNRVRHVPVLDGKKLIGIVSIGDVVKTRMEELEAEQRQLQSYITQG